LDRRTHQAEDDMTSMKAVFLLLLLLGASPANAFTVGEMFQFCRPLSERPQPRLAQGRVDLGSSTGEGVCWGSFILLQEMSRLLEPNGQSSLHMCLPDGTTAFQLVQVFTSWAREHPEQHHEPFVFGVLTAFGAVFPCK
jgi:hypothetical protein